MDTGLIIAIVIVVLVLLVLLIVLPRMRGAAKQKQAEREIEHRRDRTADLHRRQADERQSEADRLEQEARVRRAEAETHTESATLHEHGMADETLVGDDEPDLARRAGIDPDRSPGSSNSDEPPRGGLEADPARSTELPREDVGEQPHEPRRDVPGGRVHEPPPEERR